MLISLSKVVVFLSLIGALAFGAGHLSDQGSQVRLWIFNMEFTLGPLMAVILGLCLVALVWLGLKLAGLLVACFHFLNGDETAVTRYFDRNRERRGYAALSEGMIALAGGENTLALARARTAERLLKKPELTTLLAAQAAEAAGDHRTAEASWKALLSREDTRFVAVQGLLRQKLAVGDTETALKLAERAFALKPKHSGTQDLLLKLQAGDGDWKGARQTLSEKARSGGMPRALYRRRDALLALQEAKVVLDEGASVEAREAAIAANKLSPDLIPAAEIAARALIEKGDGKAAARVLKKAWEAQPHPSLAAAFAAIEPDETPAARLKRFAKLLALRPDHEETKQTEAELLLAAEDFPAAKKALGSLPQSNPTQRSLTILAAAERGMGASDEVVRAVLTKALSAPRGPQWICDKCGVSHADWGPVCAVCEGFDTLSWRVSADGAPPDLGSVAQLAPLLFAPSVAASITEVAPQNPPHDSPSVADITVEPTILETDPDEKSEYRPDDILRRSF